MKLEKERMKVSYAKGQRAYDGIGLNYIHLNYIYKLEKN